jgi:hypothetical protein
MNAIDRALKAPAVPLCAGGQSQQLDALIRAAQAAKRAASHGALFSSFSGLALVNAMYDLTQADGLYDMAGDIHHELGEDREGFPIGDDGERVIGGRS